MWTSVFQFRGEDQGWRNDVPLYLKEFHTGLLTSTLAGEVKYGGASPKTPKMAASAVEYQSVTVKLDLDTVEVRSSSLLVPTISFYQLALPASDNEGLKGFVKDSSTIVFFGRIRFATPLCPSRLAGVSACV
jgi:hypothetical protein